MKDLAIKMNEAYMTNPSHYYDDDHNRNNLSRSIINFQHHIIKIKKRVANVCESCGKNPIQDGITTNKSERACLDCLSKRVSRTPNEPCGLHRNVTNDSRGGCYLCGAIACRKQWESITLCQAIHVGEGKDLDKIMEDLDESCKSKDDIDFQEHTREETSNGQHNIMQLDGEDFHQSSEDKVDSLKFIEQLQTPEEAPPNTHTYYQPRARRTTLSNMPTSVPCCRCGNVCSHPFQSYGKSIHHKIEGWGKFRSFKGATKFFNGVLHFGPKHFKDNEEVLPICPICHSFEHTKKDNSYSESGQLHAKVVDLLGAKCVECSIEVAPSKGVYHSLMHIHHINHDGAKKRREARFHLPEDEVTIMENINEYKLMLRMKDDELKEYECMCVGCHRWHHMNRNVKALLERTENAEHYEVVKRAFDTFDYLNRKVIDD